MCGKSVAGVNYLVSRESWDLHEYKNSYCYAPLHRRELKPYLPFFSISKFTFLDQHPHWATLLQARCADFGTQQHLQVCCSQVSYRAKLSHRSMKLADVLSAEAVVAGASSHPRCHARTTDLRKSQKRM
jgi:hypothetical protein